MGVQAIDQNIFPGVLGETKVFYCPRAIEHFCLSPIPREKLFDLLPALPLNNCFIA